MISVKKQLILFFLLQIITFKINAAFSEEEVKLLYFICKIQFHCCFLARHKDILYVSFKNCKQAIMFNTMMNRHNFNMIFLQFYKVFNVKIIPKSAVVFNFVL